MILGGTIITHNCIERDYCVEAAVQSLCRVCDYVQVLDASSTDGTLDLLRSKGLNDNPHCTYAVAGGAAWQPNSNGRWLADLTNEAREMLPTSMHLNLQADEVLHEEDYPTIQALTATGMAYTFERFNFWHNHRHMLPEGVKVGTHIVRLAPQQVPSMGDAQELDRFRGYQPSKVRIYHYGFIRRGEGFAIKAQDMLSAWGWGVDPIVEGVRRKGIDALCDPAYETAVPVNQLVAYEGTHPKAAYCWLQERGYTL